MQRRQQMGLEQERGGGASVGSSEGPVRGPACRGGEEGGAWSAVLYLGSLTVPRADAAGTRGIGTCAHPTLLVHFLPAVPGPCRQGLCTWQPACG